MGLLNKIIKLFGMKTKDDKSFEQTAYHESGHTVVTYLSGYTVDSVKLLTNEPGMGKTTMNYEKDLMLIASITNVKTDPNFFNGLNREVKSQSPGVAHRISTILLAGSVAEATYLNSGQVNGNMEVEISGPDLDRVDNVHFFLSQIKQDHDSNYIQNILQKVLGMMGLPEVWTAVDRLAKALVEKSNKQLNKNEIETILQDCGYLDYLKSL